MRIGFQQTNPIKPLYVIKLDYVVVAMLVTHAGEICWAVEPGYDQYVRNILKAFVVNDAKVKSGKSRYCGKEVEQMPDMPIRITCEPARDSRGCVKFCNTGRIANDLPTERGSRPDT